MKRLMVTLSVVWVGLALACGSGDGASGSRGAASSSSGAPPATSGADSTGSRGTPTEPASSEPVLVVGADACTSDADCVPASCCHPAACVAREHTPTCVQSVCTSECRYGTLDCGGGCLCHEGHCAAHLSPRPNIPGLGDVQ